MAIDEAFGRVLRQLRRNQAVSQEELAQLAGLHRTFISQLERGLKGPSLQTLVKLAAALDTEPAELVSLVMEEVASNNE